MARLQNPWQSPLMRSYQQIKAGIIEKFKTKLPEVTDVSEGNIFIILISILAAIAEVIHYYIDGMARETFFSSAKRYSSLVKHARLVDYHVKSSIPSSVNLLLSYSDGRINDRDITIPIGTKFASDSGLVFTSTDVVTFFAHTYGVYVPTAQKVVVEPTLIGYIINPSAVIYLPANESEYYAEGTCVLYINDELWQLVDTLAYSSSDSKVYSVELDDQQRPYVKFGDGQRGSLPPVNGVILLGYELTRGSLGNLAEGSINAISSNLGVEGLVVTNTVPSSGGSNYETFDMLKVHVPLSIRTLGVAISKQDYIDLARLAPGVDKAYVDYKCGKFVDIYITPDGGGIASDYLTRGTELYLQKKKIITTSIRVLPTGRSLIYLDISVVGMPSVRSTIISDNVQRALINRYNYNSSDIGSIVRVSDIYSLVDNLSVVDYLTINKLYIMPYPRRLTDTSSELNIIYFRALNIPVKEDVTVVITGDSEYKLYSSMGQSFDGVIGMPLEVAYGENDVNITFTIIINTPVASSYTIGEQWSLNLIPMGGDQAISDFSIPIVTPDSLTIHITETT